MPAQLPGLVILEARDRGPVRQEAAGTQLPLGRRVRVVSLSEGLLPSSPLAAPLRREAQALASLDHPGVVRLLDYREDETHLVLVLEELLEESLAAVLARPLSVPGCLTLGLLLASALAHAHGRGLVHGQLSPEVVRFGPSGQPKLEGFAAGASDDGLEPVEARGGGGLSPETTIGHNASPLSDLFALGALLYHALCGKAPFGDPASPGYASRVRNEQPAPLRRLRPELPLALEQLVERCLAKTPAERPADAAEVGALLLAAGADAAPRALARDLSERGLLPAPPDELRRAAPKKRRVSLGRWHALALGVTLGAAAVGLAGWLFSRRAPAPRADLSLASRARKEALLLRVVATPWAHVLVDGAHLETTPFARPLELTPGRHVVRLEHPNAPPEERIVEGRAGEAVLLDVELRVARPLTPAALEAPVVDDGP